MDDWMVFALKNILRFDNISSNREFSINTKKMEAKRISLEKGG